MRRGVFERQFRHYYKRANRMEGITGDRLLQLLEQRLDSIVWRMGFAPSLASARQLIRHRHFAVNGRTVTIPSYNCRAGDKIEALKAAGIHVADSPASLGSTMLKAMGA